MKRIRDFQRQCWQPGEPEHVMAQAAAYCGAILSMASTRVIHLLDDAMVQRVAEAQDDLRRLDRDLSRHGHQTKEKNP